MGEMKEENKQGNKRNTSEEGKGVWKKKPMRVGDLMRRESEDGTNMS